MNSAYCEIPKALEYNPKTGKFKRIGKMPNRAFSGEFSGSKSGCGYLFIGVNYTRYSAHRLAWFLTFGVFPKLEIDHINGDKTDNRITNLRECTRQDNSRNVAISKNNTSGCMGVFWDKQPRKWSARIYIDAQSVPLGQYVGYWDAVCARKAAESKYGFHQNHGRLKHV